MNTRPSAADLQALLSQGFRLHQSGQLPQAAQLYQKVLSFEPASVDALNLLAVVHLQSRDLEGFVKLGFRSLGLRPDQPQLLGNLGTALLERGRFDEALIALDKAIALDANHPSAHFNRGLVLLQMKRAEDAVSSFDRHLALQPQQIPALISRGNARVELGRYEEALQDLDQVLRLDADNLEGLFNRGNVLRHLRRLDEARSSYERLLERAPQYVPALINLALTLGDLDERQAAAQLLRQALALEPGNVHAHHNLGNALWDLGDPAGALGCFDAALALKPGWIEPTWNKAIALLALGRYEEGWPLYDEGLGYSNRRGVPRVPRRWDGRALDGQRLLIRSEQGLGDVLQFIRYARLCKQRGAQVLVQCPPPLQRLLRLADGVDAVVGDVTDRDFDYAIEMMSLPGVFGTTLDTVPAAVPYLSVDEPTRARWAERLASDGRPQVGLVWSSAPNTGSPTAHLVHRRKSLHLSAFLPLLAIEGLRFHSLQLGDPAAQVDELGLRSRLETHENQIGDFLDTAAILEQLDLVISIDTSVAHAAGALARPVWVLTNRDACWRWLGNRPRNPWYPTARVIGQPSPGNWGSVISRVADDLQQWRERFPAQDG